MVFDFHAEAVRPAPAIAADRLKLRPVHCKNDCFHTPWLQNLKYPLGGWRMVVVAMFSLALLACLGKASPPYIGKTARPDNRIPLASLPAGETTWSAKDLKVHYRAVTAGDNLNISGFVEFGSNLGKYPLVNRFLVYLHFLNPEGVVIDTKLLWATGIKQETSFVRWTFERQWPLPPATVALGFSYRGAASEAGGKGHQAKTGWEVYQLP